MILVSDRLDFVWTVFTQGQDESVLGEEAI